jgi:hypothetical protein
VNEVTRDPVYAASCRLRKTSGFQVDSAAIGLYFRAAEPEMQR